MSRGFALVLALALLVPAAAVQARPATETMVSKAHADGEGPLSVMPGSGGFRADAPVARPYWVSFGMGIPCAQTDPEQSTNPAVPGDEIILNNIRYNDRRNPAAEIHAVLRTVTPRMVREHPKRDWGPFIAALGHAGERQPYGTVVPGRYTHDVGGHRVRPTCQDAYEAAHQLAASEVPERRLTMLVFAIKVDEDGASVRRTFVDYTINGEERTLRLDWVMAGRPPRNPNG